MSALHVRERPPLRHYVNAIAPNGRRYRWAADEHDTANAISGLRSSSTMPGGHESLDGVLPRDPGVEYGDLQRLSTLQICSPGGTIRSECRLERTPRASGDRMAISPSAVGWQANLEDDKSIRMVPVDQSAGSWGAMSAAQREALLALNWGIDAEYSSKTDQGGIAFDGSSGSPIPANSVSALVYAMPPGCRLGRVMYRGVQKNTGNVEAATLLTDDNDVFSSAASDALTLDDTLRIATPTAAARYAMLRARATALHTPPSGSPFSRTLKYVAAYDDSGIPTTPIVGSTLEEEPDGVLASDVIIYAIGKGAPWLAVTDESIQRSEFPINHLPFRDATTVAEIVRQANRFELRDWAVWDNRVFWYHERGGRGRRWRARTAPAQLEETGPQVDRLWESVIVQAQDVDGSTFTVGPPGAAVDFENELLKDLDPENPANKLGIPRRDLLVMGTASPRSAGQVGARFLAASKLLDTSGRAQHAGYIEDDRGILHPFSEMRAGDYVSYLDASDPSYRRIVKASPDYDSRVCTVDLDSPPEALTALLERLGVVLVPLGIG